MKAIKTKGMMLALGLYDNASRMCDYYPHEEKRKKLRDERREEVRKAVAALTEQLDLVQHRCRERCITGEVILSMLCDIEKDLRIPKKAMEGITAKVNYYAQKFPRAYKYTPESTWFTATYKRGQWEITGIYRDVCTTSKGSLTLTEEAEKAIISRATRIQ